MDCLAIPYEKSSWIKKIADMKYPTAVVYFRRFLDCMLIVACFPLSLVVLWAIKKYNFSDDYWLFNIKSRVNRSNLKPNYSHHHKAKIYQFPARPELNRSEREYYSSVYYQMTHKPYWNVEDDKGAYGEYLIWKELRWVGGSSDNCKLVKFLFNAYIPKGDGTTTELDVIMLCPQGVFVFESKNYSGWIFGKENQRVWYQTLPQGRGKSVKEKFYNPIHQNLSHIKHLSNYLKLDIPMFSVVVFSERCELKVKGDEEE